VTIRNFEYFYAGDIRNSVPGAVSGLFGTVASGDEGIESRGSRLMAAAALDNRKFNTNNRQAKSIITGVGACRLRRKRRFDE
jgi:hypothetical protein